MSDEGPVVNGFSDSTNLFTQTYPYSVHRDPVPYELAERWVAALQALTLERDGLREAADVLEKLVLREAPCTYDVATVAEVWGNLSPQELDAVRWFAALSGARVEGGGE